MPVRGVNAGLRLRVTSLLVLGRIIMFTVLVRRRGGKFGPRE